MGKQQCISPIDGSVYAVRATLDFAQATKLIDNARLAQKSWARCALDERVSLVMKAIDILGSHTQRMTTELAHQMGRPVRYGGEFAGVYERASYMADIAPEALSSLQIENSAVCERRIDRIPVGVVLVIAPWNYPYMTAINTIVPALIAGNAVILKHATQTMLTGEHLAESFHNASIPQDIFQNICVEHQTIDTLISSRAFDYINFTGSVEAGRAIEYAAAGTFTPVATELGGKDPAYVREDADIDSTVTALIDGAMFNSGQCCCGIERIYVHKKLFTVFLEKAIALTNEYILGNPLESATTLGPMAHVRYAQQVRWQIAEAIAAGATSHIATFVADDGAAYVSPQILTNVSHSMRIMRDETFGPVVGIQSVDDDDEAVALMNDSDFALTASLWTEDMQAANALVTRLAGGTVFLNRCDYLDPALCWSGCKNSGRGASLSVIGYQQLTRPKSYHLKK